MPLDPDNLPLGWIIQPVASSDFFTVYRAIYIPPTPDPPAGTTAP